MMRPRTKPEICMSGSILKVTNKRLKNLLEKKIHMLIYKVFHSYNLLQYISTCFHVLKVLRDDIITNTNKYFSLYKINHVIIHPSSIQFLNRFFKTFMAENALSMITVATERVSVDVKASKLIINLIIIT